MLPMQTVGADVRMQLPRRRFCGCARCRAGAGVASCVGETHECSFIHRLRLPLQRVEFAYQQPVNGAGAMHKQLAELRLQKDGHKPLKLRSTVRCRQSQRRALGAQTMLQTDSFTRIRLQSFLRAHGDTLD